MVSFQVSGKDGVSGEANEELEEAGVDAGENLEGLVCRRVHDSVLCNQGAKGFEPLSLDYVVRNHDIEIMVCSPRLIQVCETMLDSAMRGV